MTSTLAARLDVLTRRPAVGGPLLLRLTLANETDRDLAVVDPEVGDPPAMLSGRASASAYRAAVLISVRVLEIEVRGPRGEAVAGRGLAPWVTPLLAKRTLRPGERLRFELDLAELFDLAQAGPHSARIRYGKEAASAVMVESQFVLAPRTEGVR